MSALAPYRKAVVAFLVAGLTALAGALTEGSAGGGGVTASEWVEVALAALLTTGFVYRVPNEGA